MEAPQVKASVAKLLLEAGLKTGGLEIELADGGGNNRVFVVHAEYARYLAKVYFSHPADKRDRLGTEFAFLSYAWNAGLRCVPRPISRNTESNIGLYEFVEGRKLALPDLDREHVWQAARFFRDLNAHSNRDMGAILPEASEACFSALEHFALVDRRIERLVGFPAESPVDHEAISFITELDDAWRLISDRITRQLGRQTVTAVLGIADRCVSPSDFGFHNALRQRDGRMIFLDFEYFGWDDPAKMIADFLLHPAMNLSPDLKKKFASAVFRRFSDWPNLIERVESVYPLFGLKWCMIFLNEFLPDPFLRRQFAAVAVPDRATSQMQQLDKSRQMLGRIRREYELFPYRD